MTEQTIFMAAVNGSEEAARAARFAAMEAKTHGAQLLLLHVIEWSEFEVLLPQDLETRHHHKEKAIAKAEAEIITPMRQQLEADKLKIETRIDFGHTNETVITVARETGATRIFAGAHSGSHMIERFLDSLPSHLARHASVPVTIVP